jgi:plastocyanin
MIPRTLAIAVLALTIATPVAAAYEEAAVADGGTLSGSVRFVGTPPKMPTLAVNKNRDVCGATKESEALVVGADHGVKGSVVLIEGVARGKKNHGEVIIDNEHCHFVPHVLAAMVGTPARVKNSDAILHNTHGFLGTPTVFNVALPNKGEVVDITKKLTKVGAVRVLCDAHPHMMGWLYVHSSPYVATTDEHGAYKIDAIPPGTYKVTMWHEGFRTKCTDKDGRPLYEPPITVTKEVTIGPKATATLDFELK